MSKEKETDRRRRDDSRLRELVGELRGFMNERGVAERALDWDEVAAEQRAVWKRNRGSGLFLRKLARLLSSLRRRRPWRPNPQSVDQAEERLREATFSIHLGADLDVSCWGSGIFISPELAVTAAHNKLPGAGVVHARYRGRQIELEWVRNLESVAADTAVLRLVGKPPDLDVQYVPAVSLDPATPLNRKSAYWRSRRVLIFGYPLRGDGPQGGIIDGLIDAGQPILSGTETTQQGTGSHARIEYERLSIHGSGIVNLGGISGAGIFDLNLGALVGVQHRYVPGRFEAYGTAFDFFLAQPEVEPRAWLLFEPIGTPSVVPRWPVRAAVLALILLAPFLLYKWLARPEPYNVLSNYTASGWMGDCAPGPPACSWEIVTENPHSAPDCVRVKYQAAATYGGMYLQFPPDNWGQLPGHSLKGYRRLTFWARADSVAAIQFKTGGIYNPKLPYRDSYDRGMEVIRLNRVWTHYAIDLRGESLSNVIGAFAWVAVSVDNPGGVTFYLDDIRFE